MEKYIYKLVDGYKYNTISFYDVSLIGKASIYLDDNLSQKDLEKLYNINHPAVIRITKKIKIIKDEKDNG